MSRRVHEDQAYLDALADVCRTPGSGAPASMRYEQAELRDGLRGLRRLWVRWSFEPYADDPRTRQPDGRIEGESSRDLDPHPMNDFYEPEPLAEALWEQAGLEADAMMRAAYDVAPGPVTEEHRRRAAALIPSRDEWWQMLLDELGELGWVLRHDEQHLDFEDHGHHQVRFAFGPDSWFAHVSEQVVADLAAGAALERGGGLGFQGYWDDLAETLGSCAAPVLVLGEHGLQPHPDHPAPPLLPPAYSPLEE